MTTVTTDHPTKQQEQQEQQQQQEQFEVENQPREEQASSSVSPPEPPPVAAASSLVSSSQGRKQHQHRHASVIVIGAGMAGLACARELLHRGYYVLVVEARRRVGGRVKGGTILTTRVVKSNSSSSSSSSSSSNKNKKGDSTTAATTAATTTATADNNNHHHHHHHDKAASVTIDLGGMLIHGVQDNPIAVLVRDLGLPVQPVSETLLLYDRWPVDPKEDERVSHLFNECLEEAFRRVQQEEKEQVPPGDQHMTTTMTHPPFEAAAATRTNTATLLSSSSSSFGDLFEQVCAERGLSLSSPAKKACLFRWHQANLEVSCGASFSKLGWHWNDDEAYGFDGDHVALRHSWTAAVEALADGLDILYDAPVQCIHVVHPESSSALPAKTTTTTTTTSEDVTLSSSSAAAPVKATTTPLPSNRRETRKRNAVPFYTASSPSTAAAVLPTPTTRQSRRLRGVDAQARRSQRANKGQPEERFVPSLESSLLSGSTRANGKKRKRAKDDNATSAGKPDAHTATTKPTTTQQPTRRRRPKHKTVVQITLRNGTVLEADSVVCTLPLGMLQLPPPSPMIHPHDPAEPSETASATQVNGKRAAASKNVPTATTSDGIRFDPPLPLRKRQAIQRLGTGLLNKVALSFSTVFWQDSDFLGLAKSSVNTDGNAIKPSVSPGTTISAPAVTGVKRHGPEQTPAAPSQGVKPSSYPSSYLVLNAHAYTGKPVLIFLFGGDFAKDMEELSDWEVVQDCLEQLRTMVCSRDGLRDIPAPIDYHVTRWGHEQYSRMAFTYVPVGVDGFAELKAMSEPIYDSTGKIPALMFAGEHTTPYHPSTIHGAYLSGIREAYRLDCILYPESNNHLEFSEDTIFQRTFPVERKYFGADSLPIKPMSSMDPANDEQDNEDHSEKNEKDYHMDAHEQEMETAKEPKSADPTKKEVAVTRARKESAPTPERRRLRRRCAAVARRLRPRRNHPGERRETRASSAAKTSESKRLESKKPSDSKHKGSEPKVNGTTHFSKSATTCPPSALLPTPTRKSQRVAATASRNKAAAPLVGEVPIDSTSPLLRHPREWGLASANGTQIPSGERDDDIFSVDRGVMAEMENRALIRALESYGHDHIDFIHKSSLPIPMAASNTILPYPYLKSPIQFRKRCLQLFRNVVRRNRPYSNNVWKTWIAKTVYPPTTKPEDDPDNEQPREKVGKNLDKQATLRKKEKKEPKDLAPKVEVKTRSGRTIKKPRVIGQI